jgi:hypothetical protein
MRASDGPVFFLHIPKTGGTSLINVLRALTPPEEIFTEADNSLSRAYTERLAASKLPPTALLHGHPGWGSCLPYRGKARFLTLLREPCSQIISHYQHAVRDPSLPQHGAAKALGFEAFLRAFPFNIVVQTNHLHLAVTDGEDELRRALADPAAGTAFDLDGYFARRLGGVFGFLEEMLLVGVLEQAGELLGCLADELEWSHVPRLPHVNTAAPEQRDQAAALLGRLRELERDPALAPLFAIENATYAKARSLASAARLRRLRERMRRGEHQAGLAGATVHRSACGEIVLGENFEPAKTEVTWWERNSAAPRQWWTAGSQVSRLYVRLHGPSRCRLLLRADRLLCVQAGEVGLCLGERWLALQCETAADGTTELSTLLECPTARDEPYLELRLYLQWNRYPDTKPFHPAIRFTSMTLSSEGAAGAPPEGRPRS